MKKINLFEIPMLIARCKNHDRVKEYVHSDIIPTYLQHKKRQNNKPEAFTHGAELGGAFQHLSTINQETSDNSDLESVYSDYFPGAPEVNTKLLHDLYMPDIKAVMNRYKFKKDVEWHINGYYWYNITEKGGWQDTHDHMMGPTQNTICGIHHIEFGEDLSSAFFINPQEQLIRATYPSVFAKNVPDGFKKLSAQPKVTEGDIIWFPPWLKHTVAKQTSNKRRITMAMDITINEVVYEEDN